jgi:molybdopterin molybdotransferase
MGNSREMISFKEAFDQVLENVKTISDFETVTLENCIRRVLAEDVFSDRDIPPFNRSAMDGYAVRDEDVNNTLKISEILPAGGIAKTKVEKGTCIKIMTGAALPEGADRVVMVEYADESDGFVKFNLTDKILRSRNYSQKGEDMVKGETALKSGTMISARHIATLASLGKYEMKVVRKPVIGIIATGDEIVEPWETPSEEKIRNSNGWQLIAQIERAGCTPVYKGIVKDDLEMIKNRIQDAAFECDIVLVTGGVSMGDYDLGGKAVRELGYDVLFDSVAVKPGKPTTFAVKKNGSEKGEVLFGMPGNPFSVFVIFEIMVRPMIEKMMGAESDNERVLPLDSNFKRRKSEREEWIPAIINRHGTLSPVKYNGSGHFHVLSNADALFKIEKGCLELKIGEKVVVRQI